MNLPKEQLSTRARKDLSTARGSVVRTTRPVLWWAVVGVLVALFVVGLWSLTARIPQQVKTEGVIATGNRLVEVIAPMEGTLFYRVEPGDKVTKNDPVADLFPLQGGPSVPVKAPAEGVFQQRDFLVGTAVQKGARIGRIRLPDPTSGTLPAVVYLLQSEKERLQAGMPALVLVPTKEGRPVRFQTTLERVQRSPATREAIAVDAGSQAVADSVIAEHAGFAFRAEAKLDLAGKPVDQLNLAPATLVEFIITYANPRPIELLFQR